MSKFAATRRLILTARAIIRRLDDALTTEQVEGQIARIESALLAARRDGASQDASARLAYQMGAALRPHLKH